MDKDFVVGIDIGGQSCKLGVVDARGEVLAQSVIKTNDNPDADVIIKELAEAVIKLVAQAGKHGQIRGIGVGAPNGNYYTGSIASTEKSSSHRNSPRPAEAFPYRLPTMQMRRQSAR